MRHKKKFILLIIGISFCLVCVCALAGLTGLDAFINLFWPTYTLEQTPSIHDGYRRTTMTAGSTVYVSDYEEVALVSINTAPTQRLGRLPVFEADTSGIYAIPGQAPSAYALLYDPMYQQVFRNALQPLFDWRTAEFQKMRLGIPIGPAANKETTDPQVIDDVLRTLQGAAIFMVPLETTGNYTQYENHGLYLFSDQLPGLAYLAGVHIDSAGQIYLAEDGITNQWHPVSSFFLEWMNGQ